MCGKRPLHEGSLDISCDFPESATTNHKSNHVGFGEFKQTFDSCRISCKAYFRGLARYMTFRGPRSAMIGFSVFFEACSGCGGAGARAGTSMPRPELAQEVGPWDSQQCHGPHGHPTGPWECHGLMGPWESHGRTGCPWANGIPMGTPRTKIGVCTRISCKAFFRCLARYVALPSLRSAVIEFGVLIHFKVF
jgi:hypothetical protein